MDLTRLAYANELIEVQLKERHARAAHDRLVRLATPPRPSIRARLAVALRALASRLDGAPAPRAAGARP